MRGTWAGLLILFLFFLGTVGAGGPARAAGAIGTGVSATTGGRPVPLLYAAFLNEKWSVTGVTTGVQNPLYYHSAYYLGGYRLLRDGDFLWGQVRAGFGAGLYFSQRGYRENEGAQLQKADDFTGGPGFRVSWRFLGPVFLNVEAMFGLRDPLNLLLLSAQDIGHVIIGVEF